MTHAVVLVEAERDAMPELGAHLAEIPGVRECYSVTGEWDFVCVVHTPRHEGLKTIITHGIAAVSGVARTQTMVAFEAFSRDDLEHPHPPEDPAA